MTQAANSRYGLFTWRNAVLGGVAAVLIWGGVAIGWFLFGRSGRVEVPLAEETVEARLSIAVLPLANRSALEEDAFFVDGIHDDILTHLSKIERLKVISRTSVMQYAGSTKPMREIAGELGVANGARGGRAAGPEIGCG